MPEYVWVKDADGLEYAVTRAGLNPEIHEEVKGAEVVLDANSLPRLVTEPGAAVPAKRVQSAIKADLIANHGKEN